MAPDGDPYRTLGLARGASMAEVKQAYRRLAKANHPDAAGETALPRFLAIQAAYDLIVGPDASTGRAGPSAGPRRPWDAEPDRADATHRAYSGRARKGRSRAPGASGTGPTGGPTGTGPGPDVDGSTPPPSGGAPRPPNKARLGSTSYDGADREPFEPDWGGASWYGTSSGTYWTLNPKEYADPRKHGPEYQARARRAAASSREAPNETDVEESDPATTTDGPEGVRPPTAPPTHTTSSWWEATAGAEAEPSAGSTATTPDQDTPAASAEPVRSQARPLEDDLEPPGAKGSPRSDGRSWLEGAQGGIAGRVGLAVLGWIPLALAIGWAGGEITGCGRFAAECDGSAAAIVWIVQIAALAALLLLPRLARLAATGAVVSIAAAVPAVLVLSTPYAAAAGEPDGPSAVLIVVAIAAWIGGVVIGVMRTVRQGPRPVS